MKCGLAQPSGLSIDYVNSLCYIADSESSTIRQLDLKTGRVKGVVGGGRDPMVSQFWWLGPTTNAYAYISLWEKYPRSITTTFERSRTLSRDIFSSWFSLLLFNFQNLFEYGDADGKGVEVKLQHPLDVCYIPETNFVIVCDSYNHKVSWLRTVAWNLIKFKDLVFQLKFLEYIMLTI